MTGIGQAASALHSVITRAARDLVDRDVLVDVLVLAAVAGEHVLVVGPPGTAKSEAVRRVADALGGRFFEYLLGRFTEPSELFGPVNLARLREGTVETDVAGMLPEAEIAFLDEVFNGSTAILNTLLGILNERQFVRGHTRLLCPLRLCVGATNSLPADESLAAFADRFLVRVFVEPIADSMLETLLQAGRSLDGRALEGPAASVESLDVLAKAARAVDLRPVVPELAAIVRTLRQSGIALSDRRIVRAQRLVGAAAALSGRTVATAGDLWPLLFVVPTAAEQAAAQDLLGERLSRSDSTLLTAAADAASRGPVIRARRLVTAAELLFADGSWVEGVPDDETRLRVEALLRAIDAGFIEASRPADLSAVREQLVARLGQ